ncbi:MAG: MFS transporter [Alphaproteobacteria bacterium]|nr:MFS transporter [Alphaproteobacteria bacterium]MBL7097710.1 MFS transporter [Alphaproteobacteria bacterium]
MDAKTAAPSSGRIPPYQIATFAAAALPVGALVTTLGVYLTNYYAAHVGLPLAVVGLAFMSVRFIDILFDPLLGIAMDRTRTRVGKFRPWLAAAAPILLVAGVAIYFPPAGAGAIYLIGWLLVVYAGYSMLTLSQAGWGAALVAEYHQRSRVYGWIQAVGVVGALGVLLVPLFLPKLWPASPFHGTVPQMGAFVLAAIAIGAAITVFLAPEHAAGDAQVHRFGLADYLPLFRRPEMLRLMWADLFCTLGPAITAPMYLFFFEEARGYTPPQTTVLLFIYVVAGLVGPWFWSLVAKRLGKHQTIRLSSITYVIAQTTLVSLPNAHLLWMSFAMFTVGFMASSFGFLVRAMIADVSDEVRLESGKDRTAMLYAMVTSTNKVGSTLSVGVAYLILPLFGFVAKEGFHNTDAALWGLKACYLAPPVICVLIGGLAMWGYRLDEKRHSEIRAKLEADAIGGVKDTVQSITADPPAPEQGILQPGE